MLPYTVNCIFFYQQMTLDEQSRFKQELEGALEKAQMELDRRLTEQEKEHEQRVQHLIRQMKEGGNLDAVVGAANTDVRYVRVIDINKIPDENVPPIS